MAAKRIRFFRKARGLTQAQLATAVGVDPHTVYLWEAGKRTPPHTRQERIADILEVDYALFFARSAGDADA